MDKICLTSGQKSPIVLGQERDGRFVGQSKLDAGFVREIKRHRRALPTMRKESQRAREGQLGSLDTARERSDPYNK